MSFTPDQISEASKKSVDAFNSLFQVQLGAFEKLSSLNFEFLRSAAEATAFGSKAILDARGVQDLINVGTAATQPTIDKILSYSRDVYGIGSDAQAQLGELIKAQTAELNSQAAGAIDSLEKSSLPGSQTTAAALKTALSAGQSAYDSLSKAGKQASDFIEASIQAATPKTPA